MPGDRFRVLIWKVLSGQWLRRRSTSQRRRSCTLRVEALEHRTMLSAAPVTPPGPVGLAAEVRVAYLGNAPANAASDLLSALQSATGATALNGPALDRLLSDLRQLDSAYSPQFLQTLFGDSVAEIAGTHDVNVTTPVPGSVPNTNPTGVIGGTHVTGLNPATDDAGTVQQTPPPTLPVGTVVRIGSTATAAPVTGVSPSSTAAPGPVGPIGHTTATAFSPASDAAHGDNPLARSTATPTVPAVAPSEPTAFDSGPRWAIRPQLDTEGTVAPVQEVATDTTTDTPRMGPAAAVEQADPIACGTVEVNAPAAPSELSDGVLLQRFVNDGDQMAFTALVQRHEAMVTSVCRRVLGDSHAAEDAAQATFLVLTRKAGMLDGHRPLASWLYTVAYHLALRLRAVLARQRRTEQAARGRQATGSCADTAEFENQEVHQVLNEELQRLPDKYRVPLALCYLHGQTHAEAARAIGMPRGSIAKTIGEGLARLRDRLTARGITL